MEIDVSTRLGALSHPQRLKVFRLLMRRYPDHVSAGELAKALDIRPSTLSSYLTSLMHSGMVAQQRVGTSLRYAVAMTEVCRTLDYLVLDCCRSRPEICTALRAFPDQANQVVDDSRYKVLFICTGNSARSIFAESILRKEAGNRFKAHSAGTRPHSQPNPIALKLLRQRQHEVSTLRSKHLSEFRKPGAPAFDFVFTVCDQAANEDGPAWSGQPVSAHWGMPDPAGRETTLAENDRAFQQAYQVLLRRIRAFAALPVDAMDRPALQQALDDIGRSAREVTP